MRVLVVGEGFSSPAWFATDRVIANAGNEVRLLSTEVGGAPARSKVFKELRAYGEGMQPGLLRSLILELRNLRALDHHLTDFEPDIVAWWSMRRLPLSLIEMVRRLGLPAVAIVLDDWPDIVRRIDGWHAHGRYRRPRVSRILERVAGIPAEIDLDRAAHYVFGDDASRTRVRLSGLCLPDSTVAMGSIDEAAAHTLLAARSTPPRQASKCAAQLTLAVVIPTIGRPEALARTLRALANQGLPAGRFEVLVVEDAASSGGLEDAFEAAGEMTVRHLKATLAGASAARNVGYQEATADIVVFLGDDMVADSRLLEEHLAWHTKNPEEWVGVLGHVTWSHELHVTPFMRWLENGTQFSFDTINGPEATFGHFYTSNVSVKRAALEAVNGFDEVRFPFHYEDLDLGYRLAARGFRLRYNANARVEHWHQVTLEGYKRRMADVAEAELRWVEAHAELPAYYRDQLAGAAARPPYRGRVTRALLGFVPRGTPWIGKQLWENANFYYRQQLAPAYLSAWEAALSRREGGASDR